MFRKVERLNQNHGMDGYVYLDAQRYARLLTNYSESDFHLGDAIVSSAWEKIGIASAIKGSEYIDAVMKIYKARQKGIIHSQPFETYINISKTISNSVLHSRSIALAQSKTCCTDC